MADAVPTGGPSRGDQRQPNQTFTERVAELTAARLASPDAGSIGVHGNPGDATRPGAGLAGAALVATATFGVTSLVGLLAIALAPTLLLGWASTVIESSSMQPTVVRGDVVVLRPLDDRAEVGAVVRFPADDGGNSIVHRVVEVNVDDGAYVTKGDANRNDDRALVPFDAVDGLGTVLVPLVGHPALWFHEGRFAPLILAVAAGAGVVWVGIGAGGRVAIEPIPSSAPGDPAAVVVDQPLGPWSLDTSAAEPLFPVTIGHRPARDQPDRP